MLQNWHIYNRKVHIQRWKPQKSKPVADHCPRRVSRCFMTAKLASIHLSTQFWAQASSVESSRFDEIFPVTHFFQQVFASEWTAKV
jgi:hypothetical protein